MRVMEFTHWDSHEHAQTCAHIHVHIETFYAIAASKEKWNGLPQVNSIKSPSNPNNTKEERRKVLCTCLGIDDSLRSQYLCSFLLVHYRLEKGKHWASMVHSHTIFLFCFWESKQHIFNYNSITLPIISWVINMNNIVLSVICVYL